MSLQPRWNNKLALTASRKRATVFVDSMANIMLVYTKFVKNIKWPIKISESLKVSGITENSIISFILIKVCLFQSKYLTCKLLLWVHVCHLIPTLYLIVEKDSLPAPEPLQVIKNIFGWMVIGRTRTVKIVFEIFKIKDLSIGDNKVEETIYASY